MASPLLRIYSQSGPNERGEIDLSLIKKNQSKTERMNIIYSPGYVPEILHTQRPLSTKEIEDADWNDFRGDELLVPKLFMNWNGPNGSQRRFPHLAYLNPVQTKKYWPAFLSIQKTCLDENFKTDMLQLEDHPATHSKKRGGAFDFSATQEPGHQPGGIRFAKAIKSGKDKYREVRDLVIQIACDMIEQMFPCLATKEMKARWIVEASMTPGGIKNLWYTNIQANISELDKTLKEEIKGKAGRHIDFNDDAVSMSVLLCLGHYKPGYHPGRFCIWSTRCSFPCFTYGAAIFSGRHLHSATGAGILAADYDEKIHINPFKDLQYPADLDALPFMRLHLIPYPRKELLSPQEGWLSQEWIKDTEECRDLQLSHFGSPKALAEWRACFYIKNKWNLVKDTKNVKAVQELFPWIDKDGKKQVVAEEIIQVAFEFGGKPIRAIAELRRAVIDTNCGDRITKEIDPNAPPKVRKPRVKADPNAPKLTPHEKYLLNKVSQIRCSGSVQGRQCKVLFRISRFRGRNTCANCHKRGREAKEWL